MPFLTIRETGTLLEGGLDVYAGLNYIDLALTVGRTVYKIQIINGLFMINLEPFDHSAILKEINKLLFLVNY